MTLTAPLEGLAAGPRGPLRLGLAVWIALLGLAGLWCAGFGQLGALIDPGQPLGLSSTGRSQAVIALLIAFLVGTRRYLKDRAELHWAPLQPLTDLSPEDFRDLVRLESERAWSRRPLIDAAGAAIGVAVVLLSTAESELRGEGSSRPVLIWAFGANALLFALMARSAAASVLGRTTVRVAAAIESIDLLDLRPLRCFARQGLRSAFFWVGGSSIASLLAWNLDRVAPLVTILVLTLALATFALLEPVSTVRGRIRAAKEAELAALRARIRAARGRLLGEMDSAADLPALLAYEARIAQVSEWPFDTPTLVRFAALSLLATGSWLGGALVERVLDAALG